MIKSIKFKKKLKENKSFIFSRKNVQMLTDDEKREQEEMAKEDKYTKK